jgi:pyruvate formate lyase activating enzyme
MKISGIEKFSMVDYGEKIVCTVFTPGCNFRCPFCHNAALVLGGGEEIQENEVMAYLKKRRGLLDAVCISGGEPTLQKDLAEFCHKVKSLGYPIKLDTNGSFPDVVKKLYQEKLIDYVAMDIKNSLSKYSVTAGVLTEISAVAETAAFLMSSGIGYEFRTTLVNGYHTMADIWEIGNWLSGAKRYFLQKFTDKGSCLQEGLTEIPKDKAEEFRRLLACYVDQVELRGY